MCVYWVLIILVICGDYCVVEWYVCIGFGDGLDGSDVFSVCVVS